MPVRLQEQTKQMQPLDHGRRRPRLSHPHNTSMSSISRMGAKTPKPHSRAYLTVSLLECRFGVMRASLSFATLPVSETSDYAKSARALISR
jgi:hypothetical protein